jgi:hypothetical protein
VKIVEIDSGATAAVSAIASEAVELHAWHSEKTTRKRMSQQHAVFCSDVGDLAPIATIAQSIGQSRALRVMRRSNNCDSWSKLMTEATRLILCIVRLNWVWLRNGSNLSKLPLSRCTLVLEQKVKVSAAADSIVSFDASRLGTIESAALCAT